MNTDEIYQKISQANLEQEAVEMQVQANGRLAIGGEELFKGQAIGTVKTRIKPDFQMEVTGQLDYAGSNPSAEEVGEETEAEPTTEAFQGSLEGLMTLINDKLYFFNGNDWHVQEIAGLNESFQEEYNEEVSGQNEAMMKKYFDLSETEDSYVLSFNTELAQAEFYQDLKEQVDLDKLMDEQIEQTMKVLEESPEFNAEEFDKEAYSQQMRETQEQAFQLGVKMIKKLEVHYDKESYQMKSMLLDLEADGSDIAEVVGEAADQAAGFKLELHLVLDVLATGEAVVIEEPELPADALEAIESDQTETSSESVSKAASDSEASSSEESNETSSKSESESEAESESAA